MSFRLIEGVDSVARLTNQLCNFQGPSNSELKQIVLTIIERAVCNISTPQQKAKQAPN